MTKTTKVQAGFVTLVAALAVAIVSPSAHAQSAILQLMNGVTTVTIGDNTGLDSNSAIGIITYVGAVGDFSTNVTTGQTKPSIGSAAQPSLHLGTLDITNNSATAETLTILFSDSDFGPTTGTPMASLAITSLGNSGGSVTYNTYWDAGNMPLAQTTALTSIGPVTMGSSTTGASGSFSFPFALTQVLQITLNAGGTFLGSADLTIVPEANGVLICALTALVLGVGFARRRLIKS